jgi:capsular exopolysaccharide synthesis family protein
MSRLFEALSDVAMYQPPQAAFPRAVAWQDVIELGVHTDDVAPLLSAEQAETELLSAEDLPVEASTSDLAPLLTPEQGGTEELSAKAVPVEAEAVHLFAEAVPVDVSVSEGELASHLTPPLSGQDPPIDQHSAKALPEEVTTSDPTPLMIAEQAGTEGMSPEAAPVEAVAEEHLLAAEPVDVSVSEATPPLPVEEVDTKQHSAEATPAEITTSDLSPLLTTEQAGTEELSPEAAAVEADREHLLEEAAPADVSVSEEVSASDVVPPLSAEEVETAQHSAEGVPVRVIVSYVTAPLSMEQTETEQLTPAADAADISASKDESASDPTPSLSAQGTETEQSPEAAPIEVSVSEKESASELAPLLSAEQVETEQFSSQAPHAEESAPVVTPPLIMVETETERIFPQAVHQETSPSHMVSSFSTQEVVAKNSKPKSAVSEPAPPVTVRVPPEARLVALTDPNSLGAEKFRALVTRLEHAHKQREFKCFQVTSSVIHEGKTLVSGNVAVTFARYSGSNTLLIEGDLHRPTLATLFGLNNIRGLSHWWSRPDQDLAQFVYRLGDLPLWFLPAGRPHDRPSDILRSARFAKAFSQLTSRFEWIVVDSTPMLPIVDVNLWSRLVDGTLLVVREGVTPVKALKQGLLALDHPNIIGVVLNDASATNETKYDGQYYSSTKH